MRVLFKYLNCLQPYTATSNRRSMPASALRYWRLHRPDAYPVANRLQTEAVGRNRNDGTPQLSANSDKKRLNDFEPELLKASPGINKGRDGYTESKTKRRPHPHRLYVVMMKLVLSWSLLFATSDSRGSCVGLGGIISVCEVVWDLMVLEYLLAVYS